MARDIDITIRAKNEANAELQRLSRELAGLSRELRNVSGPADQAASGTRRVGDAAADAGRKLDAATGKVGRLGTELARGAAIGAGFAAFEGIMRGASAGIDFIGDAALGLNSKLQQAEIGFTTMLGSAREADVFLRDLGDFAAKTPFEFEGLVTASQRMLAFGFEAEQVIPLLTSIGDAVAAMGGGAAEIDRVTLSIGQMQAKTRVQAEEMLQLTEAGIPAWQLLADHVEMSVARVQEAVSRGEISADVFISAFQEFSAANYGDMMQQQSRTFQGAMSTIQDSLSMGIARGFEPFFEVVSEGAVELGDYLSSAEFEETVEDWTESMTDLASGTRDFLQNQGPGLVTMAKDVAGGVEDVVSAAADLGILIDKYAGTEATQQRNQGGGVFDFLFGQAEQTARDAEDMKTSIQGTLDWLSDTKEVVEGIASFQPFDEAVSADNWWNVQFAGAEEWLGIAGPATESIDRLAEARAELAAQGMTGDEAPLFDPEDIARAQELAQATLDVEAANRAAASAWFETAEAQSVTTQMTAEQTAARERELAVLSDLESGHGAYMGQLSDLEQIQHDASLANWMLNESFSELAGAYQANLDAMGNFNSQASEYSGALDTIEEAYERVQKKVEDGLTLSEEEQLILDHGTEAMDRYAGGMEDAETQAALYAIANGKVMKAQDELNAAIERGEDDLGPYHQALKDAETFLGDVEGATGETAGAQDILADAINNNLVGAIDNLTRKVEYISKPWLMEIDAATEAAEREIDRIKGIIASGAYMPVSIGLGPYTGTIEAYADGGISQGGLALVGEEGPEFVVLPKGAEVIPNPETMAMMSGGLPFLGGFANGTGGIKAEDGSIVNKNFYGGIAEDGSQVASGFWDVGIAIGQEISTAIGVALEAGIFDAVAPSADQIADAMIQGAIIPIESEIEGIPDTWAVNMERIPGLAGQIGQDTALALMEEYGRLKGQFHLAALSGEDTSEIQAQLAAIEALFQEWGASVIGTAQTVGEAMASVANTEAFAGFFDSFSLEDIVSGKAGTDLGQQLVDLLELEKVALEMGDLDLAAQYREQADAVNAELERLGQVMGTAYVQGQIDGYNAEQVAAEWDARLADALAGPQFGQNIQSSIDEMNEKIDLGILMGAPMDVIAGWQAERDQMVAEGQAHWSDVATGIAAGAFSPEEIQAFAEAGGDAFMDAMEETFSPEAIEKMLGPEQISDAALAGLTDILSGAPEMAGQFIDDFVLGINDGRFDMEQVFGMLADIPEQELSPAFDALEKQLTVDLAEAYANNDAAAQEALLAQIATLQALQDELGITAAAVDELAKSYIPIAAYNAGNDVTAQQSDPSRGGTTFTDNGLSGSAAERDAWLAGLAAGANTGGGRSGGVGGGGAVYMPHGMNDAFEMGPKQQAAYIKKHGSIPASQTMHPDTYKYLADGGVITSPLLAIMGEAGREAVMPLQGQGAQEIADAIVSRMGGANGQPIIINLTTVQQLNGREIGRSSEQYLIDKYRGLL